MHKLRSALGIFCITLLAACNNNSKEPVSQAGTTPVTDSSFAEFIMNDENTDNPDASNKAFTDAQAAAAMADDVNSCDAVLNSIYQHLSVHSHKEYLEKLNYLYESTSQQDLDSRKGSSSGIDIPNYGSLSWGSNKSKVSTLYNKYKTQGSYSLSTDELLVLSETYSRSVDVQSAHEKWLGCIEITNGIPRLHEQINSDSDVVVSFRMRPNAFRGPNDKVKVRGINYSSNLVLQKGVVEAGKKITYSGTYTLVFKRKDSKSASVSVDLEEGYVIPVTIAAVTKEPVYELKTFEDSYQCTVEIDVSANWMKITSPDKTVQKVGFKDQSKNPYKLRFYVNTKLKNPDAKILNCFYTPSSGGIRDFRMLGVKLNNNGTLSADCSMITGAKKMKGKFTILFSETKKVCVANCPE